MRKLWDQWPRATVAALLCLFIFPWYFVTNALTDLETGRRLLTPLDQAIPQVAAWQYVYGYVYVFSFLPVLIVRDVPYFRRVGLAYAFAMLSAYPTFYFFPVVIDRPPLSGDDFGVWGTLLNRYYDAPANCFPSQHISLAFLCSLSMLDKDRGLAAILTFFSSLIAISTLYVKAHYLADVAAGLFLAFLAYRLFLCGRADCVSPPEERRRNRWMVVLVTLGYGVVLAALYAPYRLGWAPWANGGGAG